MVDFGARPIPIAHASRHENDGADELDAAGLLGRHQYFYRGDPSSYDFAVGDLTTNGGSQDLDLSSIVPAGTYAAAIILILQDDNAGQFFSFKKKGQTNNINRAIFYNVVADVPISYYVVVALDSNLKLVYAATNTTWNLINICISGWFI